MTATATDGQIATIEKVRTQRFFTFIQGQDCKRPRYDADAGITQVVIVQATSAIEANTLMELMGIEFDKHVNDDCTLCGHRWTRLNVSKTGNERPRVFNRTITEMWMPDETAAYDFGSDYGSRRCHEGEYEVFVHFADGTVRGFCPSETPQTPPPGPGDGSEDSEDGGDDSEGSEGDSPTEVDDLADWEKELLGIGEDDQPGEEAKDFEAPKGGGENPWYDFDKEYAPKGR